MAEETLDHFSAAGFLLTVHATRNVESTLAPTERQ